MNEIEKRRTFAIISHPDAGKTTLTEKLLLYGGAVLLAGSVTARKNQRATTSDWMELEKQRGISVSSTVLQFDYGDYRINLLDTPGHRDFSEDTYRVLTAVDSVIMVIDAAKGIESQTRKLFDVCRQRRVPIFTFINKLDRPTRDPLELMDEIEKGLGLQTFAMNWPLGTGLDFRGVFDRVSRRAFLFERTVGGAHRAPVAVHDTSDPLLAEEMDSAAFAKFQEDVGMLDVAGSPLDPAAVLAGEMTPVYFGSAANNFGVQLLLEGFLSQSPPPAPRRAAGGDFVPPQHPAFSGFVFKIQGNMDPRHRDRVAFVRICSGQFTREMTVLHARTGKRIKLSNVHRVFGRERDTIDQAHPGDILGVTGRSDFAIGDTLTEDPGLVYNEIPRFPPECFAFLHNPSSAKYKAFRQGLDQLALEGLVQPFAVSSLPSGSPLFGAVGPLQFEVLQYRLRSEYGVESRLENAPWALVRWMDEADRDILSDPAVTLPSGACRAEDSRGDPVILFPNEWSLGYFSERHPRARLHALPAGDRRILQSAALKPVTV